MAVVDLLGLPGEVWAVGGLVWDALWENRLYKVGSKGHF